MGMDGGKRPENPWGFLAASLLLDSVNQLDKVRNNRAEHEPSSSGLHARAQSMHILYTQGIGKRNAIMITNRDMVIVRIRKRRFL